MRGCARPEATSSSRVRPPAATPNRRKSWIDDPAGISWETFLTTGESIDYGDGTGENEARIAQAKQSRLLCSPRRTACSRGVGLLLEDVMTDSRTTSCSSARATPRAPIISEAILNKSERVSSAPIAPEASLRARSTLRRSDYWTGSVTTHRGFDRSHGLSSPNSAPPNSISCSLSAIAPRPRHALSGPASP